MNPVDTFLAGIAPQHAPALVAGLLAAVWLAGTKRWRPVPVDRWAGTLLGISAAVHLALPLNPHHGPLVSAGFVLCGAGFAVLALRALRGRRWRPWSALLVPATLTGYLVAVGRGEEADQVGIATALVELTILGLAIIPPPIPRSTRTSVPPAARPGRGNGVRRFAGSAATFLAVFLTGAVVWVAAIQAHAEPPGDATAGEEPAGHHHGHAGRTQAGMIMRPQGAAHHPADATAEQRRAAADLATATRTATTRYADLSAATAAGYAVGPSAKGTDVHLEHRSFKEDGRTLDPERPEMLVFAIEDGRATLLGVVFVMERAGTPGPEPGGPLTRWHAHNLCLSVLPPGLGAVSPYGGCPAFSVATMSPEMMHVWVVDNPAGPFAESLDKEWAQTYHATHGRPITAKGAG